MDRGRLSEAEVKNHHGPVPREETGPWQSMECQNVSLRKSPQNGQAIRCERGHTTAWDQARMALEIALYLHNFGNASTFA